MLGQEDANCTFSPDTKGQSAVILAASARSADQVGQSTLEQARTSLDAARPQPLFQASSSRWQYHWLDREPLAHRLAAWPALLAAALLKGGIVSLQTLTCVKNLCTTRKI